MNLNSSSSSPFPTQQINDDHEQHQYQNHHPFGPNTSSSVSCHFFFNSSTQDHAGYYNHHHHQYHTDQNYGYDGGYEIKNKVENGAIELSLWKKEEDESIAEKSNNPVKWMSSKMRLMQKMKTHDRLSLKITTKIEESSSDLSSNSSSYNNNNSPIRVCSDCNTTKTPLWRSGPKGPKSLCNACGIRQRKARRAMAAAAAAAATGTAVAAGDQPPAMKIKVQQKEKMGKNGIIKKRCKTAVASSSGAGSSASNNGQKKRGFEDFLINLSKNLTFHRVFPEDEKDAAILLMALSSGLING